MPTIYIDNDPYEVKEEENLLKTCLGLGFDLPYFCWHPAMHSVGACRQCAVKQFKDEKDTRGRIIMACMTAVSDGMRISINDPEAKKFRAGVIEWLMTNHPHDCPVCDEGGECHLQDMTVMTGHSYRRFRYRKRTHFNQDLGPFVTHEMNRCIACYRCTRFYNDYARGTDFGAFSSHNHVYFGRAESGTLESQFAGNLVEVCPTGVFTDKSLARHYTRKWDLRTAPSVCVHCGVGCNTIPGERYGTLRRIRNRYNGEVNGYFLCDRGRYGYEFVNSDRRIAEPAFRSRRSEKLTSVPPGEAIDMAVKAIASARRVIGIGSPRASLESNFALRSLVGVGNFYAGVAGREHQLVRLVLDLVEKNPGWVASPKDIRESDAILLLGEDVMESAPVIGLAVLRSLRQRALKKARDLKIPYWDDRAVRISAYGMDSPLFLATPTRSTLDPHATGILRSAPAGLARTGFSVAHAIDPQAPSVDGVGEHMKSFSDAAAGALLSAERPVVITGVSCREQSVVEAACNCVRALRTVGKAARLAIVVPECNSLGLATMAERGLEEAFSTVEEQATDVAIILENDLYRRAPDSEVDRFLATVSHVIVLDHLFNRTSLGADAVLPATTFAEDNGTLINYEARAQRYFQVVPTGKGPEASWHWIRGIMEKAGRAEAKEWSNLDGITAGMAHLLPFLGAVAGAAPDSEYRVAGMKVAREHYRASGRTAMWADRTLFEPPPPEDPDTPFTFSMEGYSGRPASALILRFWAPGWNSAQSVNKFQAEIAEELMGGNPGVRLFAGAGEGMAAYFGEIPKPFAGRQDAVFVIPLCHVFGSEELSVLAPGIRSRTPAPYLAVSSRDASRLPAKDGEMIAIEAEGRRYRLPVRIAAELPSGIAGIPQGIPGVPVLSLPGWFTLGKVER